MKKVLAMCVLLLVSFTSSAATQKPDVEKIYDGWDLDKVYVMTDTQRGKWCYVIRDTGRIGIQCFNIKEENK